MQSQSPHHTVDEDYSSQQSLLENIQQNEPRDFFETIFLNLLNSSSRPERLWSTDIYQDIRMLHFLKIFIKNPTQDDRPSQDEEKRIIVASHLIEKIKIGLAIYDSSEKKFQNIPTSDASGAQYFTRHQFIEAYEMLVTKMFEKEYYDLNIPKFRALAMFILHIILRKRVSFLQEKQITNYVSMENAYLIVGLIYQNFRRFLNKPRILQSIQAAGRSDGVDYICILNRIFKDKCKDLTWKEVIFLFIKQNKQVNYINLGVQSLFDCENSEIKRLLVEVDIAEWNQNQGQYVITNKSRYLKLLEYSYSQRRKTIKEIIRQQKEMNGPQAYENAINHLEPQDSGHRDSFEEPIINKMSQNPHIRFKIDKGSKLHIVKLFINYSVEDRQLIRTILERRQSFTHCLPPSQYFIETCDDFRHPKLAVNCPILPFQKIQKIGPLQPADRKKIILPFLKKIFRGESCYIYSLENIRLDRQTKQVQFHFNQSSVVGLIPIIKKGSFMRDQLRQVFELLDESMFGEAQNRQSLVTYTSKFRAIAMFILYLICGQKVSLLKERDFDEGNQVSFQKTKELVKKIADRFRKFLYRQGIFDKIKSAEREDKAQYLMFLRKVFEDNCEGLQWKSVLSLFCQQTPKNEKKQTQMLDNSAQWLYRKEDEYSNRQLMQLGIVKKISQSQFELKDTDLYLHYLLPNASFRIESVADQISQQGHATQQKNQAFLQRKQELDPEKQNQRQGSMCSAEKDGKSSNKLIQMYDIKYKKNGEPTPQKYELQSGENAIYTSYDENFILHKKIHYNNEKKGNNAKIVSRYMGL